jgi:hypothetical protein
MREYLFRPVMAIIRFQLTLYTYVANIVSPQMRSECKNRQEEMKMKAREFVTAHREL